MTSRQNIVTNGTIVYLRVGSGRWYQYDSAKPPLGQGAMGIVYAGQATDDRYDRVAIKLVNPRFSSVPSIRERAKREASLAFRHENLVEMIGLCADDNPNGPMFIVSRLVQGQTLDRYVNIFDSMPDRVSRVTRTILPVLDALDYIHSKGIIHLDVKPSNIMVENERNIRLMDLGIAFTSDSVSQSHPGLLGTPGYAAPEQYVGRGRNRLEVTAATDVYETGATLYELLAGRKPYDHGKSLALIQDVPAPLMEVICRSLDRNPATRIATAREFKLALERALATPDNKPFWSRLRDKIGI